MTNHRGVPYAQRTLWTAAANREGTLDSGGKHRIPKGRTGRRKAYRIVMGAELSAQYAVAFEGMEMETKDGATILTGEIVDQPHLHGILARINGLGLELLSVECLPDKPYDNESSHPPTADRATWKGLGSEGDGP
jgi:hypothetical protein